MAPAYLHPPDKWKKTMCSFHLHGRCNKGAKCTYAHSPAELRLPGPQGLGGNSASMAGTWRVPTNADLAAGREPQQQSSAGTGTFAKQGMALKASPSTAASCCGAKSMLSIKCSGFMVRILLQSRLKQSHAGLCMLESGLESKISWIAWNQEQI